MDAEVFDSERGLELLSCGELEILGLLPNASNATLLVRCRLEDLDAFAVYKPRRGENPLWDFPSGTLCLREAAAYVVSRELGWDVVPVTVLREGPLGFGAVQQFIDFDELDVQALPESYPGPLREIALLDVLINNADRKVGHLLAGRDGRLWGVDHGICFHVEPKLRTVIWLYESEPVPEKLLDDVARFEGRLRSSALRGELSALLSPAEMDALAGRARKVLSERVFPEPGEGRNVPWPPW